MFMEKRGHFFQLMRRLRRLFERKYCMHPDAPAGCSRDIVGAHSVQRAMLVKHLAKRGHVLQFRAKPDLDAGRASYQIEPVGVNEATTFFGFCGKHDNDLFRPLETTTFDFTAQQIALLGYRSVCRELYLKDAAIASGDALVNYAKRNPEIYDAEKHMFMDIQRTYHLNAKRNLIGTQKLFASMLTPDGLRDLRYFGLRFADPPVYFSSTAFLPEWDFDGNVLQDLRHLSPFDCMSFSAWASGEQSAVVFCWHSSADRVCRPFIDSLRRTKERRLGNQILSMAFEMSETVVFSEKWWRSVKKADRSLIRKRVPSSIGENERSRFSLIDRGLGAMPSGVTGVFSSEGNSDSYRRLRQT